LARILGGVDSLHSGKGKILFDGGISLTLRGKKKKRKRGLFHRSQEMNRRKFTKADAVPEHDQKRKLAHTSGKRRIMERNGFTQQARKAGVGLFRMEKEKGGKEV